MVLAFVVVYLVGVVSGGLAVYEYQDKAKAEAAKLKAAAEAEIKKLEDKL